jgi:ferrous iron transport protein B
MASTGPFLSRRKQRAAPCCPPAAAPDGAAGSAPSVVLVGNPNVGKSTVFNAAVGARQYVGNWPGKTVQVASGQWRTPAGPVTLTDLPGTYSLIPRAPDEALVSDLLAGRDGRDRPDLVVAVVDAANLARNLYLVAQVLATGIPVVVALTMLDVAAGRRVWVSPRALAQHLGVPVVDVHPRTGARLDRLATAVAAALAAGPSPTPPDTDVPAAGSASAEQCYEWVRHVAAASVRRDGGDRPTRSDLADRVLTSRWAGLPLFFMVMWGVFVATTRLAAPLQDGLSAFVDGPVRAAVSALLRGAGLDGTWFAALVGGGLVSGVGQLLSFVPMMTIMFVLLTLLEDSGYLARAALVADRLLGLVGLPGQAFLPLIVGFGCNVPAIAGTRILPDARHRLLTSILVPFISCSARLTVYVMLADIFFGSRAGTVVFAMYVLSAALVVLVGLALRRTVFRGQSRTALLLELPPYRRPTLRAVATQTWQRLAGFLRTVGGIVVCTVVVVWLLAAIPLGGARFGSADTEHSVYGAISRAVAPVFTPAGFGDWHLSGALLTGFVAKEAVVSTLAETYGTAETSPPGTADLGAHLRATFDRTSHGHAGPAVLAFMVFLLAYTPCMATVAAQRAEIGLRWTLFGIGLQLCVAWLLATAVFQVGRMLA